MWTQARTRCILSSCLHPWTPASKNLALGEVSGGQQRRRGSALCFSSPFSAFLEEGVASTTQCSGVWEPFLWEPASPHGWRRRRAWARRSGPGEGSRQGMRSGVQVTDRENWLRGWTRQGRRLRSERGGGRPQRARPVKSCGPLRGPSWTSSSATIISRLFSSLSGPAHDGLPEVCTERQRRRLGQACGGRLLACHPPFLPSLPPALHPSLHESKGILCVCLGSSLQKQSRKTNTQLTRGLL